MGAQPRPALAHYRPEPRRHVRLRAMPDRVGLHSCAGCRDSDDYRYQGDRREDPTNRRCPHRTDSGDCSQSEHRDPVARHECRRALQGARDLRRPSTDTSHRSTTGLGAGSREPQKLHRGPSCNHLHGVGLGVVVRVGCECGRQRQPIFVAQESGLAVPLGVGGHVAEDH